jgi:hypothetical protein
VAIRFGVSSTVKNRLPRYSNFWDGTAVYSPFTPTGSYDALASLSPTGVSTLTFSGLPTGGQYSHLQIRINWVPAATGGGLKVRFNGDTTSSYSVHRILGETAVARAQASTSQDSIRVGTVWIGNDPSAPTVYVIDLLDYSNTSKYKTLRALYGTHWGSGTNGEVGLTSGLWMNSSAINSITLFDENGNNFTTGFNASIYGIRG